MINVHQFVTQQEVEFYEDMSSSSSFCSSSFGESSEESEEHKMGNLSPKKSADLRRVQRKGISTILEEMEEKEEVIVSPQHFGTISAHRKSNDIMMNEDLETYYKEMVAKKMMQYINEEF